MTATVEKLTRLIYLLVFLLVVAVGAILFQQAQIREMREIDCAAYQERLDRVGLYGSLIAFWDGMDADVAEAYRKQQVSVMAAAEAGEPSCG